MLLNTAGQAYRRCLANSSWDLAINVSQCRNIELDILRDIIDEIEDVIQTKPVNDSVDLTMMLDVNEIQVLSGELASLTDSTQTSLFVNDLNTTNEIIGSLNT